MPKTAYFPTGAGGTTRSGIDVTWTKSSGRIRIGGWYDSIVGIESSDMPLAMFLMKLGITEKDVERSFKKARGQ